ncbi:MAG: ATP-binding protein [Kiritimatiellae bacterium]|nr:ATP-binding protein [Kiritimatiellia bacterium]
MQNSRQAAYRARSLEDSWMRATEQFPVLLLTGPRQVGKTTLLEHLCEENRRYVTLDDLALRALARKDPDLFLQRFAPPVLIDEVQYAPELFSAIKLHVDRNPGAGAFWLTGSQQFRMMKGITETLAGRVAIVNLLGFSCREKDRRPLRLAPFLPTPALIGERAGSAGTTSLTAIYRRIWSGFFPALETGQVSDHALFYRSYVQTYLERDVRDLVQVGDLESFHRFLKASAARSGQILNYSDLARDVGISVNTVRHWLSVLVASFQVYLLPSYHSNLSKRLYRSPKLYFLDTGLCAHLTEWSSPETLEAGAMSGAAFETYVLTEILKGWWHRIEEPAIYYYRDKDGREIDFLIVKDDQIHPIEVKKAARIEREAVRAFRPLNRFKERVGPGGVVCLYPETLPIDDANSVIPAGIL